MVAQAPQPPPAAPFEIDQLVSSLTDEIPFRREGGLRNLQLNLVTISPTRATTLFSRLLSVLTPTQHWYSLDGAIRAIAKLAHVLPATPDNITTLTDVCLKFIAHPEPRIRTAVGTLILAVGVEQGIQAWHTLATPLLDQVDANMQLDERQRLEEAARVAQMELDKRAADAKRDGLRMVHETEGWRGLETSLLALAQLFSGCGRLVLEELGAEGLDSLLDKVEAGKVHPNRFVREAGLKVVDSIGTEGKGLNKEMMKVMAKVVNVISSGLEDNWSQVRYMASLAVRTFLQGMDVEERRQWYDPLLGRMCLNRHYVAEGVRIASRATWSNVVGSDGKWYLNRNLGAVVTYYEGQCRAENHAVREAACQGFGELCLRLEKSVVKMHVERVVGGLIECLKDESWPVRDHACRALGLVLSLYPQEADRSGRLVEMFKLFEGHLGDNIGSVRENCAQAMAEASVQYGKGHSVFGYERTLAVAMALMKKMRQQEQGSFVDRRDRESGYGSASKLARDNDVLLHTNQVMYSCGSLAPKLRRGGGCMDHGFAREKRKWEEAEGGMKLWGFLLENGVGEGWSALDEAVLVGEKGVQIEFAGDSKMREGWLNVIEKVARVADEKNGKQELNKAVERIVAVVESCRRMEHKGVIAAAMSCGRALRQVVDGYTAVEKKMREQTNGHGGK
eukprot:GFKZ01015386.1.p1 GENE.GFKZ01015386.1~~GFKZ01015386.1.p1  ORF type:complete len:677 (+),score=92.89 GFKZ01015386.1:341-2371(+)